MKIPKLEGCFHLIGEARTYNKPGWIKGEAGGPPMIRCECGLVKSLEGYMVDDKGRVSPKFNDTEAKKQNGEMRGDCKFSANLELEDWDG